MQSHMEGQYPSLLHLWSDSAVCRLQDLRVSYRRFDLLFSEGRLTECSDLALEMLHFLFRDYIYHPNLKGVLTGCSVGVVCLECVVCGGVGV